MPYVLNGREYKLPAEVTMRQYDAIGNILAQASIDIKTMSDGGGGLDVLGVVRTIMAGQYAPKLLAAILIPSDAEKWKKSYQDENLDDMLDIGDATAVEVLSNFLSGRTVLMKGITDSLSGLLPQNMPLPPDSAS